ncbi:ATP-binding protein [Paenibacillus sp. LHD-38]|uniref:ATP-binding protein n=1 Tax=Paenibacillus sp. LHD-38 TaxID=3072143 RepID=UPI00280EC97C|nr:ATP-binding protein [Paenibacillus sp. LHD-38]MDQ8735008.1 ATP-binding protein [Paenibacillus sp. LHD-38]
MEYLKDLLLNIFIICSPLALYPYIYKAKNNTLLYRLCLAIPFSLAIITTMSFPISINGLIYDFRSIPLAIGSLFGGIQVSIFLYATLLLYRYFQDSPNDLLYVLSILPSFAFFVFFHKSYSSLSLSRKITVAIIYCTLIKMVTFGIYLSFTGLLELLMYKPWATVQTYVLQGFIVGVSVYVIEMQHRFFMMQEEIVRSEKMKIVGDMAASVAHEIRNPLTTLKGFIQLFATADLDKDKRILYQKVCFEELDRAESIIADYLSLAKPDPEIVEAIDIHQEMHYLANVLMTYANYNNIQIQVMTEEEQVFHIQGDRYKFRQALINIGKNAIEAMQNGGLLELKTIIRDNHAWVILSDNGSGMSTEQMKRLGTPYYSTKEKGTGLGTMVSFGIIKKMNGKITIKSELGEGTEFNLIFPKAN